jgi:response regulator RpfG family c-di-GMP phosphodiesterase
MLITQAATLFVDDAPLLLQKIRSRLVEIGFKAVEIASSVDEALSILAAKAVAHVVSDWKMPKPGGVAFLRDLRLKSPHIRCTLLTGFSHDLSDYDKDMLEQLGIDVIDKERVSTAWLADLVGLPSSELTTAVEEEADMLTQEPVSGPADIIAEQRLRIEELERVIRLLAQDLVQELESIDSYDMAGAMLGGKAPLSVKDVIREIRMLSPLGRRLIELDRAARGRLVRAKRTYVVKGVAL